MRTANLVLFNAKIYTMDAQNPQASALAISGNRIAAIGDDNLRDKLAKNARAIDLQGQTVVPD